MMACFFTRHRWLLIDRIYAPPITFNLEGSIGVESAERMLMGCTTLIFQCQDCRAVQRQEALGRTTMEEATNASE